MKLNNNDDSHNSGLNLLIYNMLLDIESHPAWVCGLKREKSWEKAELRKAENTMSVIIENKDDIAKIMAQILFDSEKEKEGKRNG